LYLKSDPVGLRGFQLRKGRAGDLQRTSLYEHARAHGAHYVTFIDARHLHHRIPQMVDHFDGA
jgi:hypothetical protein